MFLFFIPDICHHRPWGGSYFKWLFCFCLPMFGFVFHCFCFSYFSSIPVVDNHGPCNLCLFRIPICYLGLGLRVAICGFLYLRFCDICNQRSVMTAVICGDCFKTYNLWILKVAISVDKMCDWPWL